MVFPVTMEINILENQKKRAVFEVTGTDATLCNMLRNGLWNEKGVKVAGYNISHPLIGVPRFVIETDGNVAPMKAFKDTIKKTQKGFDKLSKDLSTLK